ncbi:unnamed protein product [Prunus armeniaca]|uniref:Uncharacterized protein n=1 Tax=Prunus armeniaca TaxID=36596 RepID=A0A6J5X020_PRUAR|nr:unnamed protein product [Prunus armeniaca]
MATGVAAMMLQSVIEVSISMHDMEIEHRPYHRNCSCALHKLKRICSNACPPQQSDISFPKKKPPSSKWLITREQRRPECAMSFRGQSLESLTQQSKKKKARHGVKGSTPTQTKAKEDLGDGGEILADITSYRKQTPQTTPSW